MAGTIRQYADFTRSGEDRGRPTAHVPHEDEVGGKSCAGGSLAMTIRRFAPITVVGPNVETGIMVGAGDLIEVSSTGLVDLGGAFGGIGAPILTADGDTYP